MLGLFGRKRTRLLQSDRPSIPEGLRLYAIGDIHGRYDLLCQLHNRILADAARHPIEQKVVIYLGDYVDRGPESREVIEQLSRQALPGIESIHLRGNHEQALLGFLQEPDAFSNWLMYGGLATLSSYGVTLANPGASKPPSQLARELQLAMPEHHRYFLEQLESHRAFGDYLFVHAGIRPNVPIEQQNPEDLLWIREDFLRYTKPHPYVIVHGHHLRDEPEIRTNRIGIDTGAFATGRLTCLILEGQEQILIDTR